VARTRFGSDTDQIILENPQPLSAFSLERSAFIGG